MTYQLLGNPGDAAVELRAAARRLWVADVAMSAGLAPEVAEQRVSATERGDRSRARRELKRHVRALRRTLSHGEDVGVSRADLLGPRPLALIDRLAAAGIGCVVLDECHHLLDWWALVVSALVARLEQDRPVAMIGLTATLPDPDSSREAENYRGLLGDVDAELQLAAMVAERTVAPWRDGVRLARVTESEQAFLDGWAERFASDVDERLADEPFLDWAVAQVTDAALDARAVAADAVLPSGESLALGARAAAADAVLPSGESLALGAAADTVLPGDGALALGAAVDVPPGPGTGAPADGSTPGAGHRADDEAIDEAVDELGESDPAAWDRFWDRDPVTAVALARWWARRGLSLPAGFTPPPQARPAEELTIADRLALLHAWLHDPVVDVDVATRADVADVTNRYGVALTTGGVRWNRSAADLVCALSSSKGTAAAEILAEEVERRGEALRALVVVERDVATTPSAAVREVLGEDAGTAARVLAALCRRPEVAELGVLLVTGRGAWADALGADRICAAVNVTSAASDGRWVKAEGCDIRGAVRLAGVGGGWTTARWLAAAETALDDGAAQVLVATRGLVGEGWDHPPLNVLVDLSDVASSTAMTQLRGRAIRIDPAEPAKLASLWDVAVAHPVAPGDWQRLRRRHARWWGPDPSGAVTTGPGKLHPLVARPGPPPSPDEMVRINRESAASVADVDASRAAWAQVDPGGIAASAVHVRRQRRRRVRTRSAGWHGQALGAAGAAAFSLGGVGAAVAAQAVPVAVPFVLVAMAAVAWLGRAARGRRRDERSTLLAVAEGVAAGLVAVGRTELAGARVVVEPDPAGGWVALVDDVSDDAARSWADALAEALGPLGTPRWMVALGPVDQAWRVPAVVGTTRQSSAAFVDAVRRRVPDAELVRAGTPRATELVLAARAHTDDIERSLRWR